MSAPRPFHTQILLQAESPIAHHEGNDGNHANQMTQRMRLADGTFGRIPIITADSMRNLLRRLSAWYMLQQVGAKDLTESALRLLFSGGMLTGKGDSSQVKIDAFRELERLCPSLTLFGGCVNGSMIPGRMEVETAILVCEETERYVPKPLLDYARSQGPLVSYRLQTEEVQRVRMDPVHNPILQHLLSEGERRRLAGKVEAREEAHETGDAIAAREVKSSMLPRTYDTICTGALFSWQITGRFHSDLDEDAYYSTLALLLTAEARVGGKKGTGCGRIKPVMVNNRLVPRPEQLADVLNLDEKGRNSAQRYQDHLRSKAAEINAFLAKVDA